MKREAFWYFDVVSPYTYLQAKRFGELEDQLEIQPVPVLFAGLLSAWGQLGPAEIPAKRVHTYRYVQWLASKRDVPFRAPPRHPFNPLMMLRFVIAAGCTVDVALAVLEHIWGRGEDGEDFEALKTLATSLGVGNLGSAVNDPAIKSQLRKNTDGAISAGVYGVPTFQIGNTLFWGDDMTDMIRDWLDDPEMFNEGEYKRLASMSTASVRKQSQI